MKYLVMTRQTDDEGESIDVCESIRSGSNDDRGRALRAAQEDVALLEDICHRKAWIEERT